MKTLRPSSKLAALISSAWNVWNFDCGTRSGVPASPATLANFSPSALRRACIYFEASGKFSELFTRAEMDDALALYL